MHHNWFETVDVQELLKLKGKTNRLNLDLVIQRSVSGTA